MADVPQMTAAELTELLAEQGWLIQVALDGVPRLQPQHGLRPHKPSAWLMGQLSRLRQEFIFRPLDVEWSTDQRSARWPGQAGWLPVEDFQPCASGNTKFLVLQTTFGVVYRCASCCPARRDETVVGEMELATLRQRVGLPTYQGQPHTAAHAERQTWAGTGRLPPVLPDDVEEWGLAEFTAWDSWQAARKAKDSLRAGVFQPTQRRALLESLPVAFQAAAERKKRRTAGVGDMFAE